MGTEDEQASDETVGGITKATGSEEVGLAGGITKAKSTVGVEDAGKPVRVQPSKKIWGELWTNEKRPNPDAKRLQTYNPNHRFPIGAEIWHELFADEGKVVELQLCPKTADSIHVVNKKDPNVPSPNEFDLVLVGTRQPSMIIVEFKRLGRKKLLQNTPFDEIWNGEQFGRDWSVTLPSSK